MPRLKYVTLPGVGTNSVSTILEKAPNVQDVSVRTDENENLPEDIINMLRDLGRRSIVVNGTRYKI